MILRAVAVSEGDGFPVPVSHGHFALYPAPTPHLLTIMTEKPNDFYNLVCLRSYRKMDI